MAAQGTIIGGCETEQGNRQVLLDLLYLSACAIHGVHPKRSRVERMDLEKLYHLSRFHALTNLVFESVLSAYDGNLPDIPVMKKWREARDKAVTKNLLLDAERAALFDWMEQAGIWYMPLKGSVLKDFYPKSGMRQMADNDILFDAACQEQVRDWFVARGYEIKAYGNGAHDSYLKRPVYNFEMHTVLFAVASRPENKVWADYYQDVKQQLLPDKGKHCGYRFSDEDFYLYFVAHAYKHYRGGGTGLRTLLDFYVYLSVKRECLDWSYLHAELPKLQIAGFERQTRNLAEKTFADPEKFSIEQLSEAEQQMLDYYLSSGTYGTIGQSVKNKLSELAGTGKSISWNVKIRYIWSRLFPNRVFMEAWCHAFAPFFLRYKFFMPAAFVWRIFYNGITHARKWKCEVRCLFKS